VLDHKAGGIVSPSIWTSMATGKTPQKHGITNFAIYDEKLQEIVPYRSYHRKVKAIWNILSEKNRSVGIVNYMVTNPVEKVNGFMISHEFRKTYPETLMAALEKLDTSLPEKFPYTDDILADYYYELNMLEVFSRYLMKNKPVDFFCLYLQKLDWIQHNFWKYMEPEKFTDEVWGLTPEDISKYGTAIEDYYQAVDETLIGSLLENIDDDTIVIIASDHGFRPSKLAFSLSVDINRILEKAGLLHYKKDGNINYSDSKVFNLHRAGPLHYDLYFCSNNSRNKITDKINTLFNARFMPGNVKVFEKFSEADKTRNYDMILEINHEFYSKRLWEKDYVLIDDFKIPVADIVEFFDLSGSHCDDGIIIMAGNNIKRSQVMENATAPDVTPTLLYLMGLPVGRDMDGKIMKEAIKPAFLKNPPEYIDTYEEELPDVSRQEELSLEDKEHLEELRRLGYIQ